MNAQLDAVLRHVHKLAVKDLAELALLDRYVKHREEAAFAELTRRHGPLVLAVCRRILGHEQDAEDAFQATFLVLARKAGSIRKGEAVASWLYHVAYRIAMRERSKTGKRHLRERQCAPADTPEPAYEMAWQDLQRVLDEELNRLPAKYRAAFVLCCLEGKSRPEAAMDLGCKEGTVSSRLARARQQLQERLSRRGVTLTAALTAATISESTATAIVPVSLAAASIKAAMAFAFTPAAAAELASAKAVLLAKSMLQSMALAPVKFATAFLAIASLLAGGVGLAFHAAAVNQGRPPSAQAQDKEPDKPHPPQSPQHERSLTDRYGDPLPTGAVARLGTVRWRHQNQAFSDFAFTPDGKAFVAARTPNIVQFWEVATGKPLYELRQKEGFEALAFGGEGRILATSGFQNLTVWDIWNRKQLRTIAVKKAGPIAVTRDGRTLACVDEEKFIGLWDAAKGKEQRKLAGHTLAVRAVSFAPDGKTLISSADDATVRIWQVASGREIWKIDAAQTSIAVSPNGTVLAIGGTEYVQNTAEARLVLWDMATRMQIRQFQGHKRVVQAVAFSPDGKTLASAEVDTIHLWNAATGKEIRRIEKTGWNKHCLAFSPDGKTLASTAPGNETVIRLWDVATGKPLLPAGPDGSVRTLAFSPDGRLVATGSWLGYDYSVRLWDASTGQLLRQCEGHKSSVDKVVFTPGGKEIVSSSIDGTLRLWDVRTGKELRKYEIPESGRPVVEIALSPDGTRLTSISQTELKSWTIIVWDLQTGKRLFQREGDHPSFQNILPFAPDGTVVAEVKSKSLLLREVATGELLLSLELSNPRRGESLQESVAFSADGWTVAAAGSTYTRGAWGYEPEDNVIHLWELATGKRSLRIEAKIPLNALAFSPDGRVLAAAGRGAIQVWDVATGKELLAYRGREAQVSLGAVSFSPDGTRLAAGYHDSTSMIWDVSPALRRGRSVAKELGPVDSNQLWSDLGDDDAAKAHAAVWTLVYAPEKALRLFAERLRPVEPLDLRRVRELIADLDSKDFVVRETASKQLKQLDDQADAFLRRALADKPPLEVRRRIEAVLAHPRVVRDPALLRRIRSIHVLGQIGTPEAIELLKALTKGAPESGVTQEAHATLKRLTKRTAGTP